MIKTKSIRRRDYRKFGFFGLAVFVAVFLFMFLAQKSGKLDDDTNAANLAYFQPGYIISDYQMTDFNSMSEADIQNFLWSKGRCYNTNFSGVGTRVDYFSDSTPPTTWHVSNGHTVCLAEENMRGESAAHIIWQAAQDYQINPKVLIVLIQKETGLITDPIPNSWDYQRTAGYGCPDTAACSEKYYGFKNQIRNAAHLFRIVMDGNSSYYPIGNNNIRYSPNPDCGSSMVYIRNLATSALYRYTPYQPNAGALAAGYGTAYCGAYGNRNFYAYFEDWFGGITTEGMMDVVVIPEPGEKLEEIKDDQVYSIAPVVGVNYAIDLYGGVSMIGNGSNAQLYSKHGNENQQFKFIYNSENGYYEIVNPYTNKSLNAYGGYKRSETNVQLWERDGGCASYWKIERNDDGTYTFLSSCSGLAIDVYGGKAGNGKNIQIYRNTHSDNQKWTLQTTGQKIPDISEDKSYVIASAGFSDYAIDIYGGMALAGSGANIQVYQKHGNENQQFSFIYNEKYKAYEIVHLWTNKSLNAYGGRVTLETNVQLWDRDTGCASYWNVSKNSDGTYTIQSVCSALVLDVYGGRVENEKNVQLYRNNYGKNQKWLLQSVNN